MSDNPYASPQTIEVPPSSPLTDNSDQSIGRLLVVTLIFGIVETSLYSLIIVASYLRVMAGDREIGLFALLLFLLSAVWSMFFLIATHRLITKSFDLTAERRGLAPSLAVLCYFVPLLNLAAPYYFMRRAYARCGLQTSLTPMIWWSMHLLAYLAPFAEILLNPSPAMNLGRFAPELSRTLELFTIAPAFLLLVYSHLVLAKLAARQAQLAHQLPVSPSPPTALNELPPMRFASWGGD